MIEAPGQLERAWTVACGARYFGDAAELVLSSSMPIASVAPACEVLEVALPEWAADIGVGDSAHLLVDAACVREGKGPAWRRCDWIAAAYLHLTGWLERSAQARSGGIHSYAARLPQECSGAYDRAWVNRIFLFLRRLVARDRKQDEYRLFGPLPTAKIEITHDLDYLAKTVPLRLKNGAFATLNAVRSLRSRHVAAATAHVGQAVRLMFARASYDRIEEMCDLEAAYGVRSTWHVFARPPGVRGPVPWLFDPGYELTDRLVDKLRWMDREGWRIGLHPGFQAWREAGSMMRQRRRLASATGLEIRDCRQHWLRFDWHATWAAQNAAGLLRDSTLGFNDRSGFRNGAALEWHPWDHARQTPLDLRAIPMVLMDSHLYAYGLLEPEQRRRSIERWLGEVRAVGGQATLNYHPHTLCDEFGWRDGYVEILEYLK